MTGETNAIVLEGNTLSIIGIWHLSNPCSHVGGHCELQGKKMPHFNAPELMSAQGTFLDRQIEQKGKSNFLWL